MSTTKPHQNTHGLATPLAATAAVALGVAIQFGLTRLLQIGTFGPTPFGAVALPPLVWILMTLASIVANLNLFTRHAHRTARFLGLARTILCCIGIWVTLADLNGWLQVA